MLGGWGYSKYSNPPKRCWRDISRMGLFHACLSLPHNCGRDFQLFGIRGLLWKMGLQWEILAIQLDDRGIIPCQQKNKSPQNTWDLVLDRIFHLGPIWGRNSHLVESDQPAEPGRNWWRASWACGCFSQQISVGHWSEMHGPTVVSTLAKGSCPLGAELLIHNGCRVDVSPLWSVPTLYPCIQWLGLIPVNMMRCPN